MAVNIELSNIPATRFVTPVSRYANSVVIYWSDRRILTFETYKRQDILSTNTDKFYVVTPGTEYRPDLVSQLAYGFPDYWWKILQANGIQDIYDFKSGTNVRIPAASF